MNRFKLVGVGGTFDEFHKGHRALLVKAFEVSDKVLIGLSSDDFAARLNKPHQIATYEQRLKDVKAFLREHGLLERAMITRLDDPYGATLTKGCIEALIVSRETEPTTVQINKKRRQLGLPVLRVVAIGMVPSENHVSISSTRIREGVIDKEGRVLSEARNN